MADLPQELLQRFAKLETRVQSLSQENVQLRSQNEFLAANIKGKGKVAQRRLDRRPAFTITTPSIRA